MFTGFLCSVQSHDTTGDAGHTIVAYFSKAYEIGGVKLSSGSRTATVENLLSVTSSILTGMVFAENGTFVLFSAQPVAAGAAAASVTFDAAIPRGGSVKLILMDKTNTPLCKPTHVTRP